MLLIIAVVLVVLWIVGMVSSHTLSGFVHVLLLIAIVVIVLNIIRSRKSS